MFVEPNNLPDLFCAGALPVPVDDTDEDLINVVPLIQLTEKDAPSPEIPSLESELKKWKKSREGIWYHEFKLIRYAPSYYVNAENHFQHYWLYEYCIHNVQEALDSLVKRGYIATENLESALSNNYLVSSIKPVLKAHNLKVGGKKAELIARLLENITRDELEETFPLRKYCITEKGRNATSEAAFVQFLLDNNCFVDEFAHKMKDTTNPNVLAYKKRLSSFYYDQYQLTLKTGRWFRIKLACEELFEFLFGEKRFEEAVLYFFLCIKIDFSWHATEKRNLPWGRELELAQHLETCESMLPDLFPLWNVYRWSLCDELGLSDDEYMKFIGRQIRKIKVPDMLMSDEALVSLLNSSLTGEVDYGKVLLENAIEKLCGPNGFVFRAYRKREISWEELLNRFERKERGTDA